jgi:ankyrin repeat protein
VPEIDTIKALVNGYFKIRDMSTGNNKPTPSCGSMANVSLTHHMLLSWKLSVSFSAGCGKTLMWCVSFQCFTLVAQGKTSSTIIEDIKANAKPEIGFAFFYFDINDKEKRSYRSLLSSLTLSLTAKTKDNHSMQILYNNNKLYSPTKQELLDLLMKLLQSFTKAYIIIDALDECDDYHHLFDVINTIHSGLVSNSHLLVSSRREQDILACMNGCTAEIYLSAGLVQNDIISYVHAAVTKEHRFKKWSNAVQAQIKDALVNGSNGMFRWVACLIEELRHCPNERALTDALKCLPADLEVIYDQILQRIHGSLIPCAQVLLTWLIFGMCPLTLQELAIVVTFDVANATFDAGLALPHPDGIIEVCSSLVTKTSYGTVELAHASVKDYFMGKPRGWQKDVIALCDPCAGHTLITHCCLKYLTQLEWLNKVPDNIPFRIVESYMSTHFPLLRYAVNFWPDHYKLSSKNSTLQVLAMTFFDGGSTVILKWVEQCDSKHQLDHAPLIAYAGIFGLEDILQALVMKNGWSMNEYSIVMPFAAEKGYINIVKFILDMGTDAANTRQALDALYSGCLYGQTEIVDLLLDKGADVNAQKALDGLNAACWQGYAEIVKLLLDNGASANSQAALDGLCYACSCRHTDNNIVKLLLEKGADVNTQQALEGLYFSCERGHAGIVKLLLDEGADVNAEQALDGLHFACLSAHSEIVKLLLDEGADANAQQALDGLYHACSNGHTNIAKLLLDKGTDVNAQKALDGLNAACWQGYAEIVKLLLEKEADVNSEHLYSACSNGHTEIVKLLLDKGVDVNAQPALDGLNVACCKDHADIVKLLLDEGADVNAKQLFDGLKMACSRGHTNIIKLLLENGADANSQNALDGLEKACYHGHTEIAMLLWKREQI